MLTRMATKVREAYALQTDKFMYKFYYPLVDRITREQNILEASKLFAERNATLGNTDQQRLQQEQLIWSRQSARTTSVTLAAKEVSIPQFVYAKQARVFKEFCRSDLDVFGFESNKTSMCFLLGATGVGKTVFLRQTLRQMKIQATQSAAAAAADVPLNINALSCAALQKMNFDTFLHHFEGLLTGSIAAHFSRIATQAAAAENDSRPSFNVVQTILQILQQGYAKELLNVYGRDMVQAVINNEDFKITLKDESKALVSEIFHEKMLENCEDFSGVFEALIVGFSGEEEPSISTKTKLAVDACVSLLIRIEFDQRGLAVKHSYSRSGILVNSFLFDLLNYLEGYHPLNIAQEQFAQNIVVLENFDVLTERCQTSDRRFIDYLDHLMLRFFSETNERDHFPLILESSDSRFFTKELYEMLHAQYNTYGVIELYGIPHEQLPSHFQQIFSVKEIKLLKEIFGSNPSSWSALLESLAIDKSNIGSNDAILTRQQCEARFRQMLGLQTDLFTKEYVKFKALIQSVYTDHTVSDLLDEKAHEEHKHAPAHLLLTFRIIDTLETFIANYGTIDLGSKYAEQRILEDSVVKAMLSSKILYMRYYYSQMMFDKFLYRKLSERFIAEAKETMSLKERIKYFTWRRKFGIERDSLMLIDENIGKRVKEPLNHKDVFPFKLEAELLEVTGLDLQVKEFSIKNFIAQKLLQ